MTNWGDAYWTHDRMAVLRRWWGKISAQLIADEIGDKFPPSPTRNAVIGKADRMHLKRLREARRYGPLLFERAKPGTGPRA